MGPEFDPGAQIMGPSLGPDGPPRHLVRCISSLAAAIARDSPHAGARAQTGGNKEKNQPWTERVEEFGLRLRGICDHINTNFDVEQMCGWSSPVCSVH